MSHCVKSPDPQANSQSHARYSKHVVAHSCLSDGSEIAADIQVTIY